MDIRGDDEYLMKVLGSEGTTYIADVDIVINVCIDYRIVEISSQ